MTSTVGKDVDYMSCTYGRGGTISIANFKLEEGAVETAYSPPIDELTNDIFDNSGFGNNATKASTITYNYSSARYSTCANFNGSNTWIKTTGNSWMV